jgi:uncharacterized membrane protein YheB (UPF0754 family)
LQIDNDVDSSDTESESESLVVGLSICDAPFVVFLLLSTVINAPTVLLIQSSLPLFFTLQEKSEKQWYCFGILQYSDVVMLLILAGLIGLILFATLLTWLVQPGTVEKMFDDPLALFLYVQIPFVSGFVGWITNVVAVKMLFYPVRFVGWKVWQPEWLQPGALFGIQGVIPGRAEKMAGKAVDIMTTKLFDIKEIFSRIDPKRVTEEMEASVEKTMRKIVNQVGSEQVPSVWNLVSDTVKDEMISKAMEEVPSFMVGFFNEIKEDIEKYFDIKHMVVSHFVENRELLNFVFEECGADELIFIQRSGFFFGFLFGLLQTIVWVFYQAGWVLPAFGFIVGYATNFLALKIIFEPVDPIHICGIPFQGLFLTRQMEVSKIFSRICASEVLYSEKMWGSVLDGPHTEEFTELLRVNTCDFCDSMAGRLVDLVKLYVGDVEYDLLKQDIADQMVASMPEHIRYIHAYTDEALAIEDEMRTKMESLPPAEFEQVLHPVFQEDEIKLIIIGGALGIFVGLVQLFGVFQYRGFGIED